MYIADLHIHSRYSRATSKDCTPEYLDLWARRKGIGIVGSGDFTHPAWRQELCEKLEPVGNGLYVLKKEYRIEDNTAADTMQPHFVITGEISSIYKKYDRVRKVHSLILLPVWKKRKLYPVSWRRSGISIRMEDRYWDWTVMIYWRYCLNYVRNLSMFQLISGRRIFPCLAHFQVLIPWKNVMETCHPIFMRWKPVCPQIRP